MLSSLDIKKKSLQEWDHYIVAGLLIKVESEIGDWHFCLALGSFMERTTNFISSLGTDYFVIITETVSDCELAHLASHNTVHQKRNAICFLYRDHLKTICPEYGNIGQPILTAS